jgi:hypothetical protein
MVTRRVIRELTSKFGCDAQSRVALLSVSNLRPPTTKMRQNRSKAYRKLMAMYSTSFGFRQPYQVLGAFYVVPTGSSSNSSSRQRESKSLLTYLTPHCFGYSLSSVDSEMCETAVSQKIDLLARMESVLVGSIKMSECSSGSQPRDKRSPILSAQAARQ